MIFSVDIAIKTMGVKELFRDLQFSVEPKQKVGIIGRNGVGKSTLFGILAGHDNDYEGTVYIQRGAQVVATEQEHFRHESETTLSYILNGLPEYAHLKHIIDTYPAHMATSNTKLQTYGDALERFTTLGYFYVEDKIVDKLGSYGISAQASNGSFAGLSGGQKRFAELVRVQVSNADIVLFDEPTNHMDAAAKQQFIEWLKTAPQTVVIITHDRDVLDAVNTIVEMKDQQAVVSKGNYNAYIAQNAIHTTAKLHDYGVALKTLENLHKKIMWARSRKPSWHGTADQRNPFEVMERRLQKQYDDIKRANPKPSFWIDRDTTASLNKKVTENYQKFKARNITIGGMHQTDSPNRLLHVTDLSLGYDGLPLFEPITFSLEPGERLRLSGRNGVGKTTLVRALVAAAGGHTAPTVLQGTIDCGKKLKLGVYEQEVHPSQLDYTLYSAVESVLVHAKQSSTVQAVNQILGDYLFDPMHDGQLRLGQLSGGQKARLQLIRLLAGSPNVLILDEPTNHLDLPSIEELEDALARFKGSILYVTHDSYFAQRMQGSVLSLVAM